MPPKIEAAKTASFDTDDKRAQYARLVVFNHGVKEKLIAKDKDVNSVSQGDLQKAYKSLVGGNLLAGKEGVELISTLSKKGATDPKVAERGLTTAYAQEVRPFIMRGTLSATFGRRGGGTRTTSGDTARKTASTTSTSRKKTSATSRKKTTSRSGSRKKTSSRSSGATAAVAAPEPEATEAPAE